MKKFLAGFIFAFSAQAAVLLLSIVMTLVVPKFIGKIDFGFWQLFLLYCSYVGFLTFGFGDGFYLVNGGKKYSELNFSKNISEFYTYVAIQIIFGIVIYFSSFLFEDEKQWIFVVLALYAVIQNTTSYFSLLFQSVGRFKEYSFSVFIDKLCFLFIILILLFIKTNTFLPFIILYGVSKLFSLIYCFFNAREYLKRDKIYPGAASFKKSIKGILTNCKIGISLMFSNVFGALIIGISRLFIENNWGIKTFSEISLSFSLASFFLIFISQIGVVLFPAIRQQEEQAYGRLFQQGKSILSVLLPLVLPLFLLIEWLLPYWLPEYTNSIHYLILLLPLCLFDGKFQVLYNTFFKALRMERYLLLVNVSTLLINVFFCILSIYLDSMNMLLLFTVISVFIRALICELIIGRKVGNLELLNYLKELILSLVYIICFWFLDRNLGIVIFLATISGYYITNIHNLKFIFSIYGKYQK